MKEKPLHWSEYVLCNQKQSEGSIHCRRLMVHMLYRLDPSLTSLSIDGDIQSNHANVEKTFLQGMNLHL